MKKIKMFAAIFTVLFLSSFLTKQLYASEPCSGGDKWEVISVKGPSSLKLKSHKVGFKIKIKNTGSVKTSGGSITVRVKETFNGFSETEEITVTPGKTAPGKTTLCNVLCTNENFWTPHVTNTTGAKTVSVSFNSDQFGSKFNQDISFDVK